MTKQNQERIVIARNDASKLILELQTAHGNTEDVALEILLFDMIKQVAEVKDRLRRLSNAQ